ncbi:hypothetical protein M9Y10_019289 [Tritrichomonas musculus]|uniref:Phosphatidic acid phosphatase type 2/haloperoxidase domain-containing protein n=1 Tax=Tritrichomonas musculus TaxID=1915356 RepID=A0ABR2HJW8_9EUKA
MDQNKDDSQETNQKINWMRIIDPINLIPAILSIVLWTVATYIKLKPLYVPPYDSLSQFPKKGKNTVSNSHVIIINFVLFVVLVIIFFFLNFKFPKKFFRCFSPLTAIYAMTTAVCLTGFFTNVLKMYVGRPRPDMYAWCKSETAQYETCTNIKKSKQKGEFVSWPSGHSSNAMSGCLFICLFLQKVISTRKLWWSTFCSLFLFGAVYVACSRIRDYRHHTDDILAGLFIGFAVTIFVWQRSYKDIFFKSKYNEFIHS